MSTSSFLKFKGLNTFPNPLTNDDGADLVVASNVVIDKDNTLEPRRGMKELASLPEFSKQLLNYKDRVLTHYGNSIGYLDNNDPANLTTFKETQSFEITTSSSVINIQDHELSVGEVVFFTKKRDYSVTNSVAYFTLPPEISENINYYVINVIDNDNFEISTSPSGTVITLSSGQGLIVSDFILNEVDSGLRVKSFEMNGSLFVTANDGIKKFSQLNAYSASEAGGVSALNLDLQLDFSGTGGFLGPNVIAGNNVEVSYRVVWGTKDVNDVLILGKPSERATIQNYTGTNAQVQITFPVPSGIDVNYFYQIYRTRVFGIDQSGDEMNLVIEAPYDGYSTSINVADNTPDGIRDTGTPLYTNEYSGEGVFQSNDKPPVSKDIATYKNRAWYANTKTTQKLNATFLGFDGVDSGTDAANIVAAGSFPATLTFSSPHNIVDNDYVAIANSTANAIDGQYLANVISPTVIELQLDSSALGANYTLYRSYITTQKGSQVNRYFFVGKPEITQLTNVDKATYVVGDYFNLTSIDDKIKYTFWLDKTGTDTPPVVTGRVLQRIDISDSGISTIDEVRDAIKAGVEATGDFTCLLDSTPGLMFISTATSGAVTDVASATEFGTSFTISKTQDGFGENVAKGFIRLSSYVSPALAIEDTAKSLVRVISSTPSSPVYAYYLNSSSSLPGQFYLEEKNFSETSFTVKANSSSLSLMFNPALVTTGVSSTNSVGNNVLMFSKTLQPEAVPTVNLFRIGPQDKAIQRILGLRDSLFILKEEGIYRLTGENESNFNVALFDNSATLIAPDTATILNNQIYCLTTQGVATISETGVGIISRPIEEIFIRASSPKFVNTPTAAFGVGYEADRAYLLFIPKIASDATAKVAYRYNTFTQTWTTFDLSATCGTVNIKNKLYLGADDITSVLVERKDITSRDYVDRQYTRQISTVNKTKVYVDNASNIEIGDSLTQNQYIKIDEINALIGKLKIDPSLAFPANYSLVSKTGGPDLANALQNLAAQLNSLDDTRVNITFDGQTAISSNQVNYASHGLIDGDIITISGNVPQGLTSGNNYQVVLSSTNTFKLRELLPLALNTTGTGLGTFVRISGGPADSLVFNMAYDVDVINGTILAPGHTFNDGDVLSFNTTGTPPAGMFDSRAYVVTKSQSGNFKIVERNIPILPAVATGSCSVQEIYYYGTSQDSEDLQTGFNTIVNTLNSSEKCFFSNYETSSGSEELDLLVTSVNVSQNFVTLANNSNFYVGNVIHYKSIKSEIITDWNAFQSPALLKHVRTGSLILENNSLNNISIGYATDLSGNYESDLFTLDGNGDFGRANFGETAFGGDGTAWPLRTILPRQKQRCRMLRMRVYHFSAFIKYAIFGYSYDYEVTSERGYRNK